MEGPHNTHGWVGFDEIPSKTQPESKPGSKVSPWQEPEWEGYMAAIYAILSTPNLDRARWGRELMEPRNYSNSSYMELWLRSVALNLLESGRASLTQLTSPRGTNPPIIDAASLLRAQALKQQARGEAVPGFGRPGPDNRYRSPVYQAGTYPLPRWKAGDRVTTVLQTTIGHTRQYPIYRGKNGIIDRVYPVAPIEPASPSPANPVKYSGKYGQAYPDIECRGGGEDQRFVIPLYNVRFEAVDIWGQEYAEPGMAIYVDLWETQVTATVGTIHESIDAGGRIVLEWGRGVLESSPDMKSWQEVPGAVSPYMVPAGQPRGFFRLRL